MAAEEKDAVVLLERSARATRGKRMTKLLDEEIEQDEQFWNQDALKEEENDTNYEEDAEAEAEAADVFDSDFDSDESEPDDDGENVTEEREIKKKKLIFPGKPAKKRSKRKELTKLDDELKGEKYIETKKENQEQESPEDTEAERSIRKSTRTSVIVRQAEREAIRAAVQATRHPVKKKKEGEERRMTQEEMLLEAAQTEITNLRNLERVLAREEEVKKKAIVHKDVYTGPLVRYHSQEGKSFLEFVNGMSFSTMLSTSPSPYPEKSLCVVTGLPAKYRDPKTGLPYATAEAFRIIRERSFKEANDKKKRRNMVMGPLLDFLTGKGFSSKQKRSAVPRATNRMSSAQHRRFHIYNLD